MTMQAVVPKPTQSVQQQTPKNVALVQLASRLSVSTEILKETLIKTAFKECKTNEEFVAAVIVANTYGLNPILKEMYVFPAKGGGIMPIVSIDGWISLVNRQDTFDGVELIENEGQAGEPGVIQGLKSVTATFYIKGKNNPVKVTEYMAECYDQGKEPWKRWPRRMLRHKAYIQGARIAFGFSGIYDEDEASRIIEVTSTTVDTPIVSLKGQEVKQEQSPVAKEPVGAYGELTRFSKEDQSKVKEIILTINKYREEKGEDIFNEVCTWNNIDLKVSTNVSDFAKVVVALSTAVVKEKV